MANVITGFRITAGLALLFCPVFSLPFYVLYLTSGLSDMVDGVVARRTNTASEFGAKLDTAADFVFVTVCLIRLLPVVEIPAWMCVWIGVIALIKGVNVASGFIVRKRFVTVHTVMNKVTGALCAIATFAAVQEGYLIRTGNERRDEVYAREIGGGKSE